MNKWRKNVKKRLVRQDELEKESRRREWGVSGIDSETLVRGRWRHSSTWFREIASQNGAMGHQVQGSQ
jgi:hypothetical protein